MTGLRVLMATPAAPEPLDRVPVLRVLAKCSEEGGPVFHLVERSVTDAAGPPPGPYDLVVIPGGRGPEHPPGSPLALALRTHARAGRPVYTICSGAFLLAGTGLLRGRTVATHSRKAAALARVGGCRIRGGLIRDGFLTSAGGRSAGHVKALAIALRIVADHAPQTLHRVLERLDVAEDSLPVLEGMA